MPHNKFWIASAIENTSRPQWLACDIGVRKKPSEERGPKLIIAIRQPQITITKGVRQPTGSSAVAARRLHRHVTNRVRRQVRRWRDI